MDKYTGTVLKNRYILDSVLGVGGMAIVYKATDKVTGNVVAVKILKDEFVADEQFRRRFLNESRAISMLRHRNIVSVIDFEFEGNVQYIVMEYIDGITLKDFMRTQKALPYSIASKITMQILSALQHAHERGIIHRDIKPQNIMLLSDGTIKVMDFGIARISKFETVTMTDKAIGTVYYISPEQARGEKTDQRADIYSTGVMLYEMLTGTLAFDGDTPVSVALKQIQSEATRPREIVETIPEGLEQIVRKSMMKNPEKRYQSAMEMINDLRLILQDPSMIFNFDLTEEMPTAENEVVEPEEEEEKVPFWSKGNIIAMAGGVVAALIIILIAFLVLGKSSNNKPQPSESSSVSESKSESKDEEEQVKVPYLVGSLFDDIMANKQITDNFTITRHSETTSQYEEGYVFKQSIDADTMVTKGTEIVVTVSGGAKEVPVPDLENTDIATARATLDRMNLNYEIVTQPNETIEKDRVIRTSPSGSVNEGETIIVYVSAGPTVIKNTVPNVVGKHVEQAKYLIESRNFVFETVEKSSDTVEEGYVIEQYIPEGEELEEGQTVTVEVSTGPEEVPESQPEESSSEAPAPEEPAAE